MASTHVQVNGVEKPCLRAISARHGACEMLILVYRETHVTSEKLFFIEFDRNFTLGVATVYKDIIRARIS